MKGVKAWTILVLAMVSIIWAQSASGDEWSSFRGSLDNTAYRDMEPFSGNISLDWEFKADSSISTTMISHDDWVVLCTSNGTVYKLNLDDGSLSWKHQIGTPVYSTPLYLEKTGEVIVCDSIGRVTAVSIDAGTRSWRYETPSEKQIESSPNGQELIYFGSYDSQLYSLEVNGTLFWNYIGCEGWIFTSPAIDEGRVYFGSCDGLFRCLDAVTGDHVWNFSAEYIPSSPAVSSEFVYFGSYDSNLYCLDADNGDLLWNSTLGDDVHSSPAVSEKKGKIRVAVGSNDGMLNCLDGENGDLLWNLDLGPDPLETSPVISGGLVIATYSLGIVFVDISDGSIYRSFEYGDSRETSPSLREGIVLYGDSQGYARCLRFLEDISDVDDDDALDMGVEDEPGRDLLILVIGIALLLTVIGLVFLKKYKVIRRRT